MLMKAGTNRADFEAIRTSPAIASDRPAPAATPLTTLITGLASARNASMFAL